MEVRMVKSPYPVHRDTGMSPSWKLPFKSPQIGFDKMIPCVTWVPISRVFVIHGVLFYRKSGDQWFHYASGVILSQGIIFFRVFIDKNTAITLVLCFFGCALKHSTWVRIVIIIFFVTDYEYQKARVIESGDSMHE